MKLYKTQDGEFYGSQAEAGRGRRVFKPVEVPTSKPELMAFLNALRPPEPPEVSGADLIAPVERKVGMMPELGMGYSGYSLKPDEDMYETVADRVLSPPDTDGIVQRIMAASGYELKRYASAVAQRFAKLGGVT